MSIFETVTVVFLVLKLIGFVKWSFWVVLSPLILNLALLVTRAVVSRLP